MKFPHVVTETERETGASLSDLLKYSPVRREDLKVKSKMLSSACETKRFAVRQETGTGGWRLTVECPGTGGAVGDD